MFKSFKFLLLLPAVCALFQVSCRHQAYVPGPDTPPRAVIRDGVAITLRDQKLTVIRNGKKVKDYDISSSKFGVGGRTGSHYTPTGIHAVTKKVGEGQPSGMVFKGCRPTGEVVPIDAAGRDPIVTRVIQIAGLEQFNKNSHSRRIYIHGTPEERNIGRPASYGCIRMRSDDVLDLFPRVYRGMPVVIECCSQEMYLKTEQQPDVKRIAIPENIVANLPTDDIRFRPAKKRKKAGRRGLAARGGKAKSSRKSRSIASKNKKKKSKARKKVASTGKKKRRR
ncbi:MAG: L,D-transpeptidase [Akkermansiaceae bacterium]|nr:L,D-transpeptidase [Akkermansiaceae bacterium]